MAGVAQVRPAVSQKIEPAYLAVHHEDHRRVVIKNHRRSAIVK